MKKVFVMIKKMIKWYLEKSANSYSWCPSGMIPYDNKVLAEKRELKDGN